MFWRHVALISLMSCVACLTRSSCAGFDATLVPEDGQGSETCAEVGACDSCNACFGLSQLYYVYMVPCPVLPPPPPHGMVPPPLPPYLIHFAHATVAKRTFPYFCMHAAVAKRTFSFCWMNPPAGFGGSIARNCGEMQILSSRNCSAQCTGHFNAQQMESYTYYISMYIHIHKHQ